MPLIAGSYLFTSVVLLPGSTTWHDQQRLGQIALALVLLIGLCLAHTSAAKPGKSFIAGAGALLLLGLFSALLSHNPAWAITEIALLIAGMGLIAWATASGINRSPRHSETILLALFAGVCCIMAVQFAAGYVAGITVPGLTLKPWDMVSGFSNVRFQGQFLTLALPLLCLACTVWAHHRHASKWPTLLLWLLAALIWVMLISVGTRGSWAGLIGASLLLACYPLARKPALQILGSAMIGLALTYLLFHWVPLWAYGESAWYMLQRLGSSEQVSQTFTSLSGRGELWAQAWQMTLERPWWGWGPMHFAQESTAFAAHPHNIVLQLSSEWGIPATLVALALAARLAYALHQRLHMLSTQPAQPEHDPSTVLSAATTLPYLSLALLGFAIQSLVDGTWVMPYTQTTAAIVLGWAWATVSRTPVSTQHLGGNTIGSSASALITTRLLLAVCTACTLWLVAVALRDAPIISSSDPASSYQTMSPWPRFWANGKIHEWPH